MKTISINVEVSDKQYEAMHKLAEIRGYESLEEELHDELKSNARRAIETLKDEEEDRSYRSSKIQHQKDLVDIMDKSIKTQESTISNLIQSVNSLRDSIEKAR